MRLENTRDVTVYPPLLALKPGERRNVRVAVPGSAFGAVERTYRVIIQELPGAPKTGSARQVQVLTRLSIPVFVRPDTVREDVRVEGLAVEKGSVVFRVVNAGNVTERPESVTVEARDAGGTTVASTRWEGWYVLSGERREYAWPVPASACKQAASVAVTVKLESRELAARSAVPRGACGE
jgi:fimbrial chaperone protein